MARQISQFAISKGRGEKADDSMPELSQGDLEKVMKSLENEASQVDQDSPQDMARFMRKMFDASGMELGEHMKEAMDRMESGEDPNLIEEDLGDLLNDESAMFTEKESGQRLNLAELQKRVRPPRQDPELYDL